MISTPTTSCTKLVVAIDIQREYVTPGRPFHLDGIEAPLANCRRVIGHARAMSWPLAHVRHVQEGHVFNEALPYSQFVEGFEPLGHEMVFTKGKLSCYSDLHFRELMESIRGEDVFIIGFNSIMCCLATIVDGYNRGHKLTFVHDASLAKATKHAKEHEMHIHATDIIGIYARVVTTEDVLAAIR